MQWKKQQQGFTLLEVLLVVVIIAIMALTGINFYQHYSIDSKVNKTAQQMQLILQAAASYYTDQNCWPGANTCSVTAPPFSTYLTGISANPWGSPYHYQIESLYQKKFQVYSGNIPGALPNQLTKRVIAQLANAGLAPDGKQVLAEITIPKNNRSTQQASIQLISITSSGDVENGQVFASQFECPAGWQANAVAIPYYITTITYDKGHLPVNSCMGGSRAFGLLSAPSHCTQVMGGAYYCTFITEFTGQEPNPALGTMCLRAMNTSAGAARFVIFNWCYNSNQPVLEIKKN